MIKRLPVSNGLSNNRGSRGAAGAYSAKVAAFNEVSATVGQVRGMELAAHERLDAPWAAPETPSREPAPPRAPGFHRKNKPLVPTDTGRPTLPRGHSPFGAE